jgi:hypothetical protein
MRKMDEMELHIRDKAIRWSSLFTTSALFAWAIYYIIKSQIWSIPLILLNMQSAVYHFVTWIASRKAGVDSGKS